MKYLFSLIFVTVCSFCNAQIVTTESKPFVKKSFLIILSSKNYASAKKLAAEASSKLKLKLDLRGLKPNKESGLTFKNKECAENGWEYPCYVSRGKYDDGEFVTIDYSNAFEGFAKGYYIVTTASGEAAFIKNTLTKVKKLYKTAYVKQAEIYVGCMH